MWASDRVHLRSAGHRHLAYCAATLLGVPDARALEALDAALHTDDDVPADTAEWLRRDAVPWVWRRMRGRAAGDGRQAKHEGYVTIDGPAVAREAAARP